MKVERHYDDEALLVYLEKQPIGADAHLSSCGDCSEKLETFQMITDILHEHDVWDTQEVRRDPAPETIANLRAFADRMAFEDTAAEAILPELLAGSREEWLPRLMEHPEWRTAGVVRRLLAESRRAVETMPPDALEMTTLATAITDHFDTGVPAGWSLARLRGHAWHDRAYALFYVGRFSEAVAATETADVRLQECVVDEYDRARVAIIRALSLRAMEDIPAAAAAVRFSSATFVRFGDVTRLASARLAETHLLFTQGEFETALRILEPLERQLRGTRDANIHARVLGNLGYCLWKLGRIEDALRHHDAAAALLDDLGVQTEAVRVRWNVASILAGAGLIAEAQTRLEKLRTSFDDLGMTSESALVSLDIADLLIAQENFGAVEEICRTAMLSFERAGISYSARALTALAYMREAARHRTVTPALVKQVRDYLRRLPQDAELLFAPPPPEQHFPTSR